MFLGDIHLGLILRDVIICLIFRSLLPFKITSGWHTNRLHLLHLPCHIRAACTLGFSLIPCSVACVVGGPPDPLSLLGGLLRKLLEKHLAGDVVLGELSHLPGVHH